MGEIRNTLWVATTWGCRVECLSAVVDAVNLGLEQGLTDRRAADLVLGVLSRQLEIGRAAEATPDEIARLLEAAVQAQLLRIAVCDGPKPER